MSSVSRVRHNLTGFSCKQHIKIKPKRKRQIFKMLIERIYLIQKKEREKKKGYRLLNRVQFFPCQREWEMRACKTGAECVKIPPCDQRMTALTKMSWSFHRKHYSLHPSHSPSISPSHTYAHHLWGLGWQLWILAESQREAANANSFALCHECLISPHPPYNITPIWCHWLRAKHTMCYKRRQ